MKSKDLIKRLQELDPTGETHVKDVYYVEMLAGYYDGYNSYIEDDIFHIDSVNPKINLREVSLNDFIELHDGDMEILKEKIKINLGNFLNSQENTVNQWKYIDKLAQEHRTMQERLLNNMLPELLKEITINQAKIRHDKGKPLTHSNSMEYIYPDGTTKRLNQGSCEIILTRNYFENYTEDEVTYWKLKGANV